MSWTAILLYTTVLLGLGIGLGGASWKLVSNPEIHLVGRLFVISVTLHVYFAIGFLIVAMWGWEP